ncbi:RidA family protein [Lachnospiraceae bacterium 62-35]
MKTLINSDKAPAAAGPYSQAIRAGEFVFVSGQLPVNPADNTMPEGIEDQAKMSLANVKAVLEAAGCTLNDVVKTTVFLSDMGNFSVVNEIYAEHFGSPFPARSCFQVGKLPKDALVEVEAIAVLSSQN